MPMPIRSWLAATLLLTLTACTGGAIHLNLLLNSSAGLTPEAPIVLGNQVVGKVVAVQPDGKGGLVAKLEIESEFREQATQDARFVVVHNPSQVELKPGRAGAAPLTDGATVIGSIESDSIFPLGEIIRGFAEGLSQFREQVERFRSEMQRLPDSQEAQRLRQEWERLAEEMKKAQESTEESVKKDLLPKLQRDLDELQKKFKALDVAPPARPSAI